MARDYDGRSCNGDRLEVTGIAATEELGCLDEYVPYNKYLVSDSNNVTLRFVSDESGNSAGFELTFEETQEGCCSSFDIDFL